MLIHFYEFVYCCFKLERSRWWNSRNFALWWKALRGVINCRSIIEQYCLLLFLTFESIGESAMSYDSLPCVLGVRIKYLRLQLSKNWLKKIIWVIGVLRRTVVSDWRFDNLCGSHLQSQVENWNPLNSTADNASAAKVMASKKPNPVCYFLTLTRKSWLLGPCMNIFKPEPMSRGMQLRY